jgi:hypothetical protein
MVVVRNFLFFGVLATFVQRRSTDEGVPRMKAFQERIGARTTSLEHQNILRRHNDQLQLLWCSDAYFLLKAICSLMFRIAQDVFLCQ